MDKQAPGAELSVKFLESERIYLRRLSHEDVGEEYLRLLSDPECMKYLTVGKLPPSLADLDAYVSGFDGSQNAVAFAIVGNDDDKFLGTTTLNAINWVSGTADVGMMLGAQYRGRKYPQEVLAVLIPYAFDALNLRRLYMGVLRSDAERIASAETAGFLKEGVWRSHSLVDGEYEDEILFGLLKS